jgi:hypothetical protein
MLVTGVRCNSRPTLPSPSTWSRAQQGTALPRLSPKRTAPAATSALEWAIVFVFTFEIILTMVTYDVADAGEGAVFAEANVAPTRRTPPEAR